MFAFIHRLLKKVRPATQGRRPQPTQRVRLEIETLEQREVMSVTPHGGAILPHVELQALYLGTDWSTNSTYYQQTGYLEGFLNNMVHSTFMDTLTNAGYGTGQGSFDGGKISLANLDKTQYLTDGQIQSTLQGYINNGTLKSPDSNRLYVVFVEDNVVVKQGTQTSQNNFAAYHGAFAGNNVYNQSLTIHYAVVTYPYGYMGNATNNPKMSALNEITEAASHEIGEAVTDANVGYSTLGWYDDALNQEIGDVSNGQVVFLNGYAVQRMGDKNDQPMTPAGATASQQVSFVLQTNGNLWEHSSAGWTFLSSGIASVSDQGIDNNGKAMVDVVTTTGSASEYHDGSGFVSLWTGVKSAVAGQGVSYVLFTNGVLDEYRDSTQNWSYLDNSVSSISAGTDHFGVNAVDMVFTWGDAWEHSDSTGWHFIASNIHAVSAGQQGIVGYVTNTGNAYWYNEANNSAAFLASNVSQVTIGTDTNGTYMIDLLYTNHNLSEYRSGTGWLFLDGGVQSISKARAGLDDVVFSWGDSYEHTANGWNYLTSSSLLAS